MSNEMNQQPRKRGPMGRMGRGMQPGEKPKDLKKSSKQLAQRFLQNQCFLCPGSFPSVPRTVRS